VSYADLGLGSQAGVSSDVSERPESVRDPNDTKPKPVRSDKR